MATHSSILAWRIPGTEEPSGPPSMGSHRVRHDWGNLAAAAAEQLTHTHTHTHTHNYPLASLKKDFWTCYFLRMSQKEFPRAVENLPSDSEALVLGHFWGLAKEAVTCNSLFVSTMTCYLGSGLRNSLVQGQHKHLRWWSFKKKAGIVQTWMSYISWRVQTCSKMWRQHCRNNHRTKFS